MIFFPFSLIPNTKSGFPEKKKKKTLTKCKRSYKPNETIGKIELNQTDRFLVSTQECRQIEMWLEVFRSNNTCIIHIHLTWSDPNTHRHFLYFFFLNIFPENKKLKFPQTISLVVQLEYNLYLFGMISYVEHKRFVDFIFRFGLMCAFFLSFNFLFFLLFFWNKCKASEWRLLSRSRQ